MARTDASTLDGATVVRVMDDDGVTRGWPIELSDVGQALLDKVVSAVKRGRWPVICWTDRDEPWAITRCRSAIEAVHLLDLQHRREIQGVIVYGC
mgnify:CR=1 FL=1